LVNMAEETINPGDVMPRAIVATVVITVILYVLIATIAVAMPDREALTSSAAPLAVLFESVTGYSGTPVSAMASIAMINGILVQIVMASRVIYGMSSEGLAPKVVGVLHSKRRTPIRAILLVTICIGTLALGFELVNLAQATSLVILSVFIMVNLALWRIGSQPGADHSLHRWRYWGVLGAALSAGLLGVEVIRLLS
ncbi:MAG: amino acid permease, partial [Burkholderiaceae bacterium]